MKKLIKLRLENKAQNQRNEITIYCRKNNIKYRKHHEKQLPAWRYEKELNHEQD